MASIRKRLGKTKSGENAPPGRSTTSTATVLFSKTILKTARSHGAKSVQVVVHVSVTCKIAKTEKMGVTEIKKIFATEAKTSFAGLVGDCIILDTGKYSPNPQIA